jgi:hypothetical protein
MAKVLETDQSLVIDGRAIHVSQSLPDDRITVIEATV